MKALELMKETYSRKRYIRLVHISWVSLYLLLFLFPFPPDFWNWGFLIFCLSGAVLPVVLSAGIFGDDLASGRMSVLITRPVTPTEFFVYRLAGLGLQGTVHLAVSAAIVLVLHALLQRGSIYHFGLCLCAAWLLFHITAALSTALSVFVKRSFNSIILLLVAVLVYPLMVLLLSSARGHPMTEAILRTCKYLFPIEMLFWFMRGEYGFADRLGCIAYSLFYVVVCSAIGIGMLYRREYDSRIE